jgi:hypothetical protein
MGFSARFAILAGLGLGFAAEPCLAETPADAASRWGLLGAWRTDCRAPVTQDGSELTYAVRNGRLFLDRDWGDGEDSNEVASATIDADGSIAVVIVFPSISQTRLNAFIKDGGKRIRSMVSKDVNSGEYSIKDGKFTSNDGASSWLLRCR